MQGLHIVVRLESSFLALDRHLDRMPPDARQIPLALDVVERFAEQINLPILDETFGEGSLDVDALTP